MKKHVNYGDRSGGRNGNAKLSGADVAKIRRARAGIGRVDRADKRSTAMLAKRFGVTPAQISKIALGHQWSHASTCGGSVAPTGRRHPAA